MLMTASSPSPRDGRSTGLLNFEAQFPDRFFDVGIADNTPSPRRRHGHGGLKPVVAIYSTFFSRAFDQAHSTWAVEPAGRLRLRSSGVTGDDGPSHHGLLDIALCLAILT